MKKENTSLNFVEVEHEMLNTWKNEDLFHKIVEKNKGGKRFRFLDGPMTANNPAGVHHIWGRTLKDMQIKYHAMKGESQQYQNGFDAQGLWVEVNVEKELGLNGKPEIINYGLANFTKKCMERVDYYANLITNQSIRMGQFMDWENSYFTNSDENELGIWSFLKECDNRGWIVRKYRPMAWCPRCGTSLSDHEMSGCYSDRTHTTIYAKLPVKNKDFKLVAWTTTPWTLTANSALAVNKNLKYVKVDYKGEKLVVGLDSVKMFKGEATILEEFGGEQLVGLEYETCFPEFEVQKFAHKVYDWEEVGSDKGSCIVHIAPGCGESDFELGEANGIPAICPINDQGIIVDGYGEFSGIKTTDVVDAVVNRLKNDNKLLFTSKITHSYAHCWRCKTDIVYKLITSWCIKVDELRPLLLKAIDDVEFSPEYAKKRMQDWLINMGDWPISRSRFYGLPLPFYVCPKCGKAHVLGSLEELKQKAVNPELVDKMPNLHRPWIDDIKIKCDCGEIISRITDVGDCWLDSGITPLSTKKYFTDREYFNENFPNDYVCEMIEQVRLWFFSCLVMSVVLTGKAPYKRIITHQYVKDENGEEFHKSGGNSLLADHVADKVGADVIRYLYGGANPTIDVRFGYNLADETKRKLLGFWNVYTFFNTYASIDNPKLENYKVKPENLTVSDKWLLESTNKFIEDSDKNYSSYKSYLVVKDFENFVDDISNFYIRENRKRFWKSDNQEDQLTAYYVLYNAIKVCLKVMAPIIPFVTDYIWRNMVTELEPNEAKSVHLSNFPTVSGDRYEDLTSKVAKAREIIYLAQKLRNEHQIKVKQPLRAVYIKCDEDYKQAVTLLQDITKEELNVKEIIFVADDEKFNNQKLALNFKKAGAVLKGDVNKVKQELENMGSEEMSKLVKLVRSEKDVEMLGYTLAYDMFEIKLTPKNEFAVANLGNNLVVLDIELTEDLIDEGYLRELLRNLQLARKEAGFDITDRIYLDVSSEDERMDRIIKNNKDLIKTEVLAKEVAKLSEFDFEKEIDVSGIKVVVKLKK